MGAAKLRLNDIDQSVSPFYAAVKRTWKEFCTCSSIHGLKYTQDRDTGKLVRFVWLLITLAMLACAITMVITFYLDYRSNPTRMSIEKDTAPVESLTFPAVTICPEVLYNVAQTKRYLEALNLPSGSNITQIFNSLSIMYGFLNDDNKPNTGYIELLQTLIDLNNITIQDFIGNLQWKCEDIFFRCRFQRQSVDCMQIFQRSRTVFGYCCSFNLNLEGLNYTGAHTRSGLYDGLSIILHQNGTGYDVQENSVGFKVLITENDVFPSAGSIIKFVSPKQENFLGISPIETYCSSAVKQLPIEERQCVLPHEFTLKYFARYVGNNCEAEFRAQNMIETCGCLTFFFYSNRTEQRVCSFKDIPCLVSNFGSIIGRFNASSSLCPNSCELMDFNVELTNSELWIDIPTVDEFYKGIQSNHSVVHIFFNSQIYRRLRRDQLSNMLALISNLGSAFSLFVGISLISIVEIFYYLTVILRKFYIQEVMTRKRLRVIKLKHSW
ncbi:PREDICTED: sodium channel protein Nach [Rhagoletis zephyria]|uniref:sodium channel protein Nach n=1 Tax=Rhagoletis zephyria TaxID=28612 RepID=UPI0008112E11|nr:PREDICTED: sodium channel protein Nach [Rhagoletis zephyria]